MSGFFIQLVLKMITFCGNPTANFSMVVFQIKTAFRRWLKKKMVVNK